MKESNVLKNKYEEVKLQEKDKNKNKNKEQISSDDEDVIISEDDSFKGEDDDENQENGIIQKKLRILVVNGEYPGNDGEAWVEAKALVQNGTNKNVIWGKESCRFVEQGMVNNPYKSDDEKDSWNNKASLCCGGSGSAVMQLHRDKIENLTEYALDADVVVLVNTDTFVLNKENGLDKKFEDVLNYRKVILYGGNNANLESKFLETPNRKHLDYKEGCGNLLRFIRENVVGGDPDSNFIGSEIKLEIKKIKKNIKLKEKEIEVLSDFEGKNKQKRLFDKVKQYAKKYAKKYPKSTVAGSVAGAGVLEELFGKFLFGKSILGGIFGYNSNPKEKDAKNVKDNKKDEKKSDKKVNNSGNQVK